MPAPLLSELFEGIKYFESGTPEIPVVACRDRQPLPPGGRRDVAVFDGHAPPSLGEQDLLLGPAPVKQQMNIGVEQPAHHQFTTCDAGPACGGAAARRPG